MKKIIQVSKLFTLLTKIEHDVLYIGGNVVKFKLFNQTFPTKEKVLWLEVNGRTPFLVSSNEENIDIALKINAMF